MYPNQNPYFATGMVQQPTFYQPPQAPSGLRGKTITTPNDITISDVPSDGSIGVFPSQDGNYILTKTWAADGTVSTVRFLREKPQPEGPTIPDLVKRIDNLEKRLNNKRDQG